MSILNHIDYYNILILLWFIQTNLISRRFLMLVVNIPDHFLTTDLASLMPYLELLPSVMLLCITCFCFFGYVILNSTSALSLIALSHQIRVNEKNPIHQSLTLAINIGDHSWLSILLKKHPNWISRYIYQQQILLEKRAHFFKYLKKIGLSTLIIVGLFFIGNNQIVFAMEQLNNTVEQLNNTVEQFNNINSFISFLYKHSYLIGPLGFALVILFATVLYLIRIGIEKFLPLNPNYIIVNPHEEDLQLESNLDLSSSTTKEKEIVTSYSEMLDAVVLFYKQGHLENLLSQFIELLVVYKKHKVFIIHSFNELTFTDKTAVFFGFLNIYPSLYLLEENKKYNDFYRFLVCHVQHNMHTFLRSFNGLEFVQKLFLFALKHANSRWARDSQTLLMQAHLVNSRAFGLAIKKLYQPTMPNLITLEQKVLFFKVIQLALQNKHQTKQRKIKNMFIWAWFVLLYLIKKIENEKEVLTKIQKIIFVLINFIGLSLVYTSTAYAVSNPTDILVNIPDKFLPSTLSTLMPYLEYNQIQYELVNSTLKIFRHKSGLIWSQNLNDLKPEVQAKYADDLVAFEIRNILVRDILQQGFTSYLLLDQMVAGGRENPALSFFSINNIKARLTLANNNKPVSIARVQEVRRLVLAAILLSAVPVNGQLSFVGNMLLYGDVKKLRLLQEFVAFTIIDNFDEILFNVHTEIEPALLNLEKRLEKDLKGQTTSTSLPKQAEEPELQEMLDNLKLKIDLKRTFFRVAENLEELPELQACHVLPANINTVLDIDHTNYGVVILLPQELNKPVDSAIFRSEFFFQQEFNPFQQKTVLTAQCNNLDGFFEKYERLFLRALGSPKRFETTCLGELNSFQQQFILYAYKNASSLLLKHTSPLCDASQKSYVNVYNTLKQNKTWPQLQITIEEFYLHQNLVKDFDSFVDINIRAFFRDQSTFLFNVKTLEEIKQLQDDNPSLAAEDIVKQLTCYRLITQKVDNQVVLILNNIELAILLITTYYLNKEYPSVVTNRKKEKRDDAIESLLNRSRTSRSQALIKSSSYGACLFSQYKSQVDSLLSCVDKYIGTTILLDVCKEHNTSFVFYTHLSANDRKLLDRVVLIALEEWSQQISTRIDAQIEARKSILSNIWENWLTIVDHVDNKGYTDFFELMEYLKEFKLSFNCNDIPIIEYSNSLPPDYYNQEADETAEKKPTKTYKQLLAEKFTLYNTFYVKSWNAHVFLLIYENLLNCIYSKESNPCLFKNYSNQSNLPKNFLQTGASLKSRETSQSDIAVKQNDESNKIVRLHKVT